MLYCTHHGHISNSLALMKLIQKLDTYRRIQYTMTELLKFSYNIKVCQHQNK